MKVATGALTSCGIRTDGAVDRWGSDEGVRQVPSYLGNAIDVDVQCWGSSALALRGGPYTSIAVTVSSVCGLQVNGKANKFFSAYKVKVA